jgi:hypothetical protein
VDVDGPAITIALFGEDPELGQLPQAPRKQNGTAVGAALLRNGSALAVWKVLVWFWTDSR